MNFASKYVYANRDDSDEDEVEVEDNLFYTPPTTAAEEAKSESLGGRAASLFSGLFGAAAPSAGAAAPSAPAAAPSSSARYVTARSLPSAPGSAAPSGVHGAPKKAKKVRRKVDTNVINLQLGSLGGDIQVATGDAVHCGECKACLSHISNLQSQTEGASNQWLWVCEFCGHHNFVELEEEEKPNPSLGSVDYIIEQAQVAEVQSTAETYTIFCIDISGSMCVTQPYEGKIQLRGDRSTTLEGLRAAGDDRNQRLPNERRNVTYIARLQAVQAAVQQQIERIARDQPMSKVAIVTFNREVTIVGDGVAEPLILSGDRLNHFDELLARGRGYEFHANVGEARRGLEARLFALEEGGPTALGPAVVAALGMCEGKRGARVVVCTDGLANVGLGSMDGLAQADDETKNAVDGFYDRVGRLAAEQGICVDVIGIQGDTCDLERLGRMAELAGGTVSLVDPLNLHKDFSGILANPVLATNVSITLLLHRGLKFRKLGSNEQSSESAPNVHDSVLHQDVGNVTGETELSFEYQLRPTLERAALGVGELTDLPFQVQIKFTRLNGMKCIRVMTQSQPVTTNKEAAEAEAKLDVLSSHVAQQCATLAADGVYTATRGNMRAWGNYFSKITNSSPALEVANERQQVLDTFRNEMQALDVEVNVAQIEEEEELGRRFSDSEDNNEGDDVASMRSYTTSEKLLKNRRERRSKNDALANRIQKTKKASHNTYSAKSS